MFWLFFIYDGINGKMTNLGMLGMFVKHPGNQHLQIFILHWPKSVLPERLSGHLSCIIYMYMLLDASGIEWRSMDAN